MKKQLTKHIQLETIGLIKLIKRRGRTIRISFNREGVIVCSMPYYVSEHEAINFIISKKDWIDKHQQLLKNRKQHPLDLTSDFTTRFHTLKLVPEIRNTVKTSIKRGITCIQYPEQYDIKSLEMQKIISRAIEETWRIEAKKLLVPRTIELAQQFNFSIKQVNIRKTISRWGSCSYENNISLSLYLMQLSDELIDMVILHELCHTVEKNHGPRYKALLLKVCPHIKELEKKIKQFSIYPF